MGLTRPRAYQIFDIDYKQSVRVVTVSNVTLSGGAPSTVDGVALSLNDRVLVTGQSTGSQNGLYYVTTVGTGSNGTWARSIDGNETGEIDAGMIVMVTEGTTYADTQWKLTTNDPIVIGSTALTFVLNVQANSISSGSSNVVVNANANVTVSSAGTANVFTVSSTGTVTSGTASVTGNATVGNIIATIGTFTTFTSAQGGTITGTLVATSANAQFFNQTNGAGYITVAGYLSAVGNITGGNLITAGLITATGNITGGNITTAGRITATANITGGNILTVGQVSSTGTITTAAGTNSTGFAVGNGAVSNVGLGFFPTAGTRGDYAIRDYSSVFSTMYLDVGMGGSAGGEFQFRSSNAFSLVMRANTTGVYSPGVVSATGTVYGSELNSTNSQANEGGQINLALPSSGSTLSTSVIIDVYQNKVRFFEGGGTARGAYIDLTSCSAGAATNLLAGGGGGTPGGSNTQVQFNDGGTFGGNGQFTYDKVTNTLTAGIVAANNNGSGTNFKVGDDIWIGDVNIADTMRLTGQQNGANAYIVFGNADGAQLGRAGTGPLTYAGAFSATGNITGGNILGGANVNATTHTGTTVSVTANITGGNILTGGLISATGNITGGNLSGTSIVGTLTTAAQTNITSVGTLGSLSVTGNITGGNVITGTLLNGTSNIKIASSGNIDMAIGASPMVTITTTAAAESTSRGLIVEGFVWAKANGAGQSGNVIGGNIRTGGTVSATGNITGGNLSGTSISGTLITAAQTNITSVGTLSSLTVTANITGGNILTSGLISATGNITAGGHVGTIYTNSIINTGANATGNIGSSTLYFNTAFVKATSAQYADLAEMYVADSNYNPGTVVEFGGEYEVTQTVSSCSTAIAGIISTNPSYLMNSCQLGEHVLPVALTGRVPCRVLGPVKKGDVLISSNIPGVAQRIGANWQPGCTVGKAMESITEPVVKTIEVAVGRL